MKVIRSPKSLIIASQVIRPSKTAFAESLNTITSKFKDGQLLTIKPSEMASSICQRLINKVWRSFANDLGQIPEAEGIYAIGHKQPNGEVVYVYVGHSNNMHRRVPEHKYQDLDIDKFVKAQFKRNGGKDLTIKWVEDEDSKCKEGDYISCMERKLGYQLKYNKKRGNQC